MLTHSQCIHAVVAMAPCIPLRNYNAYNVQPLEPDLSPSRDLNTLSSSPATPCVTPCFSWFLLGLFNKTWQRSSPGWRHSHGKHKKNKWCTNGSACEDFHFAFFQPAQTLAQPIKRNTGRFGSEEVELNFIILLVNLVCTGLNGLAVFATVSVFANDSAAN